MENISIVGAISGGILAFILGGIWYSPALFGKTWAGACGLTEEQIANANVKAMILIALPLSLIAALVFAGFLGNAALGLSVAAGFAAGLFWVATSFGINYVFEQKSLKLLLVNGGYHTAQFTLYGLCIGLANTFLG